MTTIVLELHVQPGAKRTEIAGMYGARLKIRVAAPASDGTIERGAASRQKQVTITGVKRP